MLKKNQLQIEQIFFDSQIVFVLPCYHDLQRYESRENWYREDTRYRENSALIFTKSKIKHWNSKEWKMLYGSAASLNN